MQKSGVEIKRSGNTVNISTAVTLTGGELSAMNIRDGETLTLDFTMAVDVDELARLIGNEDVSKPGWQKRIAGIIGSDEFKNIVEIGARIVKSLS